MLNVYSTEKRAKAPLAPLEPGKIRARLNGSSGGQKGMQNIIDILGSDQIKRIRVGIGEPPHSGVDWVLNKPTGEDEKEQYRQVVGQNGTPTYSE